MILDNSCTDFLKELGSKAAVPGGDGASAYAGALGTALGSMVGHLTVGKKKYAAVEDDIQKLLTESEALSERFCKLVQRDAEVFEPLSEAYRLPSQSDDEKRLKDERLQSVLKAAAEVPLEIAQCAVEALKLLEQYAEKGSSLAVSDAGTGALFCKAALQGAGLNVLINTKIMKDEELKYKFEKRLKDIEVKGTVLANSIYHKVRNQLET